MLGSALKTKKVVKKTVKPKKEPKKEVPKFTEAEINGKKNILCHFHLISLSFISIISRPENGLQITW